MAYIDPDRDDEYFERWMEDLMTLELVARRRGVIRDLIAADPIDPPKPTLQEFQEFIYTVRTDGDAFWDAIFAGAERKRAFIDSIGAGPPFITNPRHLRDEYRNQGD